MSVLIVTAHHKYTDSIKVFGRYFKPMQVGSALSEEKLGISVDSDGINISSKNKNYCELTAHYNTWKNNTNSDYLGLMHYRRALTPVNHFGCSIRSTIAFYAKKFLGFYKIHDLNLHSNPMIHVKEKKELDFHCNELINFINKNNHIDIFLPKRIKFAYVDVKTQYALRHCKHQFEIFNETLIEIYPDFKASVERISSRKSMHAFNMFVMKKELYNEYNSILFNVLEKFEERISLKGMNQHQSRIFGFLSERFFNYYLDYKGNSIKKKELSVCFIDDVLK